MGTELGNAWALTINFELLLRGPGSAVLVMGDGKINVRTGSLPVSVPEQLRSGAFSIHSPRGNKEEDVHNCVVFRGTVRRASGE